MVMSIRAGDEVPVTIERIGRDGLGVGHVVPTGSDVALEIHVAGAGPGDEVVARVEALSRHKGIAFGRVKSIERDAGGTRRAPCHHAAPMRGECGGCALMHLTPEAQRAAKEGWVAESLAGLWDQPVPLSVVGTDLAYRNRTNFLVEAGKDGNVRLGSRAPRTGELVRMGGCLVLAPPLAELAATVEAACRELGVKAAPAAGGLRYVSLRVGDGGRCLIELIVLPGESPWASALVAALSAHSSVAGVVWTENASGGNAIRGGSSVAADGQAAPDAAVFGDTTVGIEVAELRFRLGAAEFFQLNTAMAQHVAARATELAGRVASHAGPVYWDLYCGTGLLGLAAAKAHGAGSLFGAESSPASVATASAAAEAAGVVANFQTLDLAAFSQDQEPAAHPSLIIVNPPRKGVDGAVMDALLRKNVPVLMMSCHLESFARDARTLVGAGYPLLAVEAFDMLPQTPHVELLALFGSASTPEPG